jgi:hypothetical protein
MKNLIATGALAAALSFAMPMAAQAEMHSEKKGKDAAAHKEYKQNYGMPMFEKTDTDGDGKITEAEFMAHAKERFTKMDEDNDGSLTKMEANENKHKMKEHMKEKRHEWREKRKDAVDGMTEQ